MYEMKRVAVTDDHRLAWALKARLEQQGIEAEVWPANLVRLGIHDLMTLGPWEVMAPERRLEEARRFAEALGFAAPPDP